MTHKPEHEHLPHSLIVDLKYDVEALKKKLSSPDAKSHELMLEIESMKDAVHKLNVVFDKALKEMKEDDLSKTFHNLTEKLNAVTVQNETIAQGMVALSDRLDAFMGRGKTTMPATAPIMSPMQMSPSPIQHTMGAPLMPGRVAPRPEMPPSEPAGFPPPPPGPAARKRVGLF